MSNLQRWANTLEKLHDIEPAPFNPNYDAEKAKMAELRDKFMYKIRKELTKLETKDNEDILCKIEDIFFITMSAVLGLNGYSIVNDEFTHKTEKGKEYIKKTFNK